MKKLLSRLANAHVIMRSGRIPLIVLLTVLLPVVLGALVCAPTSSKTDTSTVFDLTYEQTVDVLRNMFSEQVHNQMSDTLFTARQPDNTVPVCLTKGADVWTVFDGGVRDELAMRRLVWDQYPTANHEGNPFTDPLAFQPMDTLSYNFTALGQGYVCYNLNLGIANGRYFRIWGDHWYLRVRRNPDRDYYLEVIAAHQGQAKAKQVVVCIKEVINGS